jgi:hypothetical protein
LVRSFRLFVRLVRSFDFDFVRFGLRFGFRSFVSAFGWVPGWFVTFGCFTFVYAFYRCSLRFVSTLLFVGFDHVWFVRSFGLVAFVRCYVYPRLFVPFVRFRLFVWVRSFGSFVLRLFVRSFVSVVCSFPFVRSFVLLFPPVCSFVSFVTVFVRLRSFVFVAFVLVYFVVPHTFPLFVLFRLRFVRFRSVRSVCSFSFVVRSVRYVRSFVFVLFVRSGSFTFVGSFVRFGWFVLRLRYVRSFVAVRLVRFVRSVGLVRSFVCCRSFVALLVTLFGSFGSLFFRLFVFLIGSGCGLFGSFVRSRFRCLFVTLFVRC